MKENEKERSGIGGVVGSRDVKGHPIEKGLRKWR